MVPMRQRIVVDFPGANSMEPSIEVEDRGPFDSAIGIVVGLGLGLVSWGVIVALWLALVQDLQLLSLHL